MPISRFTHTHVCEFHPCTTRLQAVTHGKRKPVPDSLYCAAQDKPAFTMTDDTSSKPWGGRFTESTDAFVEEFTASIGFDHRLYRHDIAGSIAHARMLAHVNIITDAEAGEIINGLEADPG